MKRNRNRWIVFLFCVLALTVCGKGHAANNYGSPEVKDDTVVWDDYEILYEEYDPNYANGTAHIHAYNAYDIGKFNEWVNHLYNGSIKLWPNSDAGSPSLRMDHYYAEKKSACRIRYSVSETSQYTSMLRDFYGQSFSPGDPAWIESYLQNNFVHRNCTLSESVFERRADAFAQYVTIGSMQYVYTWKEYTDMDYRQVGREYAEQPWYWFQALAVFGDYVLELECIWTNECFGFTDVNSTMEKVLSHIHYPTVESGKDDIWTSDPEATVELKGITPESGQLSENISYDMRLSFSRDITGIDFTRGGICLCDQADGSVVWTGSEKTVRKYQNTLILRLPAAYDADYHVYYYPGHTYYLKMDADLLTFVHTAANLPLGNDRENPEWKVSVLSASIRPVTGTYQYASTSNFDLGKYEVKETSFTFDPAYFTHSSFAFDPQLALFSMHMAQAAYGALEGDGDRFIKGFLSAAGFQHIYTNEDYNKPPERHTAGVAIASRKLSEDTTLLAVAVRGGNYTEEWGGNFALGKSTLEHEGFAIGRDKVISALKKHIRDNAITGHVKILLAGYSRASAIINLAAAKLIQDPEIFILNGQGSPIINYSPTDIYSYGFEVPACSTSTHASDEQYSGIYNLVNPTDLVPRVPLYKWGFTRYGNDVLIPEPGSNNFMRYIGEVQAKFQEIYGAKLPADKCPDLLTMIEVNALEREMGKLVYDRESYYDYYIKDITTFFAETFLGEKTLGKRIFIYYFVECLKTVAKLNIDKTIALYLILDKLDVEKLAISHYSEYTMSWLEVLADRHVLENNIVSSTNTLIGYLELTIQCPIEVQFFDEDDHLLGSFKDGQITLGEEPWFYAEALEDGGLRLLIPQERELNMLVTATDTGQMNVTVTAYDIGCDQPERKMSYTYLPLETGKSYTLQFASGHTGLDFELSLKDPDGNRKKPNGDVYGERIDRPKRSDATEAPWTEPETAPEATTPVNETTAEDRPPETPPAETRPAETSPKETLSGEETVPQTSPRATKSPTKQTTSDNVRASSSDQDEDGLSLGKILLIVLTVLAVCGGAAGAVILTRRKK